MESHTYSLVVNADSSNFHSNGQNDSTGIWKITESSDRTVGIEVKDNNVQAGQFVLIAGDDRKIYRNDNKLFPAPSDLCP